MSLLRGVGIFFGKSTHRFIRILFIRGSILSLRGVRRDATTTLGAAACDGWRRRGAGALPSRSPGHRSSPAALAGCRCLARRALREVPKCLRASYTRATIDRAPSPKLRDFGENRPPFSTVFPPSSRPPCRSTSFTVVSRKSGKKKKRENKKKIIHRPAGEKEEREKSNERFNREARVFRLFPLLPPCPSLPRRRMGKRVAA